MITPDQNPLDTTALADEETDDRQHPQGDGLTESSTGELCLSLAEPTIVATVTTPDMETLAAEKAIYLALKDVFQGASANTFQDKAIQKRIKKRRENSSIKELIDKYSIKHLCDLAKGLLCDDIFQSTLKASLRFPDLFDQSPAHHAEREVAEIQATETEATAVREAAHGGPKESLTRGSILATFTSDEGKERDLKRKGQTSDCQVEATSLYPVHLPLATQHELMVQVQRGLEYICYYFAQREMQGTLRARRWDCAEAAELNRWTEEFLRRVNAFSTKYPDHTEESLEKLFRSVANIRHTAVHRVPTNSIELERFLLDAETLAKLLDDAELLSVISKLRLDLQLALNELDQNKQFLQLQLKKTLSGIAAERAKLDLLETEAVTKMMKDDRRYQTVVGKKLHEAINEANSAITNTILQRAKGTSSLSDDSDSAPEAEETLGANLVVDLQSHNQGSSLI